MGFFNYLFKKPKKVYEFIEKTEKTVYGEEVGYFTRCNGVHVTGSYSSNKERAFNFYLKLKTAEVIKPDVKVIDSFEI